MDLNPSANSVSVTLRVCVWQHVCTLNVSVALICAMSMLQALGNRVESKKLDEVKEEVHTLREEYTAMQDEVRGLREEVSGLRQQNDDMLKSHAALKEQMEDLARKTDGLDLEERSRRNDLVFHGQRDQCRL